MTPIARSTAVLLNVGHALDHLFLLIFATAVGTIAADFGMADWEALMPFGTGAFFLFGLGSLPAGRLGDLWGRRPMMLVFYFGMAASALLVATTQGPWSMAVALTLLGAFSAIYHPVGIPMLVRGASRPGRTIGISGLSGNLGIASAALVTGFLVKHVGWRAAFVVPAIASAACGLLFMRAVPRETSAPAQGKRAEAAHDRGTLTRVFFVMTTAAISGSLLFNFTTNGNAELLRERFTGISTDPAVLGTLLAGIYVVAAFSQVAVGHLIDRYPLKRLYFAVVCLQAPLFVAAARAEGWTLLALQMGFMIAVFGAIPFTDALIVRYVDDRIRSRVSGMRLTVAFGVSAAAVWALGPIVKAAGFATLLLTLAGVSLVTLAAILLLPPQPRPAAQPLPRSTSSRSAKASD